MADVTALAINRTLNKSPEISNTQVLIDKGLRHMRDLGAQTDSLRVVDYDIAWGTASGMGEGDQWPQG